jgi:hypothetical protein
VGDLKGVLDLRPVVDLKFFLLLRIHLEERGPKAGMKCSISVSWSFSCPD